MAQKYRKFMSGKDGKSLENVVSSLAPDQMGCRRRLAYDTSEIRRWQRGFI